jgi:pimeloyl-ACP methyl ester carboxylesterase
VPTLIVWGTGDRFFHRRWAQWLQHTIPGATDVIELPDARLFFPDEHACQLTTALQDHWRTHP